MAQRGGKREGAGRRPGRVSAAKRALAEMARDHAEGALETLASIHADKTQPASARVSAATAILDRAYGKPPQALEHTGKDGGPITTATVFDLSKMTDAELEAYRTLAASTKGYREGD